MKSIDFRTNWIPDFLPIGSLWLETSATALCGPYVILNLMFSSFKNHFSFQDIVNCRSPNNWCLFLLASHIQMVDGTFFKRDDLAVPWPSRNGDERERQRFGRFLDLWHLLNWHNRIQSHYVQHFSWRILKCSIWSWNLKRPRRCAIGTETSRKMVNVFFFVRVSGHQLLKVPMILDLFKVFFFPPSKPSFLDDFWFFQVS